MRNFDSGRVIGRPNCNRNITKLALDICIFSSDQNSTGLSGFIFVITQNSTPFVIVFFFFFQDKYSLKVYSKVYIYCLEFSPNIGTTIVFLPFFPFVSFFQWWQGCFNCKSNKVSMGNLENTQEYKGENQYHLPH